MSESQVNNVERVRVVVGQICKEGADIDNYRDAVDKVTEGVRNLARLEGRLQSEG
jgi:hypothetical protein